jgi:hypothetical protein
MAYTTQGIDGKISGDHKKEGFALDDYGDEKWDAVPQEIERLLSKTAKVDKDDIDSIKRMGFKGLTAEEILWAMGGLNIGRRLELLNNGFSDDMLDTLIRKYTFCVLIWKPGFAPFIQAQRQTTGQSNEAIFSIALTTSTQYARRFDYHPGVLRSTDAVPFKMRWRPTFLGCSGSASFERCERWSSIASSCQALPSLDCGRKTKRPLRSRGEQRSGQIPTCRRSTKGLVRSV